MKILFIAARHSPFDHNVGSGKDYDLYQAFVQNGATVQVAGPFTQEFTLVERIYRKAHAVLFERRPAKYNRSYLQKASREAMAMISAFKPDVIFSKHAAILCRLKTDVPIVSLADTTLYGSQSEWPIFTQMAFLYQNRWEQKTYDMAARIIAQSKRSANILVEQYKQPAEKVHVLPAPASLPSSVVPDQIHVKELEPLKLLLVGRDYHRKGIDIAIETIQQLSESGIPAQLRIVGVDGNSTSLVEFCGLYNKTIPEELDAYTEHYRWANFLLHPARFEAAGIVPAEAAAFGVPTITNDVGGLGTTVAHGVSGVVLPKHSRANAYVDAIKSFLSAPSVYHQLCQSTKQRYVLELNWDAAGSRLFDIVQKAARDTSAASGIA